MLLSILCSLSALSPGPVPTPPLAAPTTIVQDEHQQEIAAAGEDVAKLMELATAWKEAGKEAEAKDAYTRILEIDPDHEEAHKALRHHNYDGKWFTSYAELSKYRREEAKLMKEKGLSRHGDAWVPTADLPYLRMGWEKNDQGVWLNPVEVAKAAREAAFLEEGRQLRPDDSTWIHPDEFQQWTDGLWKCGEEWLTTEEANAYHSKRATWWQSQGEHFEILTTCDWETLRWVRWHADLTYGDLIRLFGIHPAKRPSVVVFSNIADFNAFAAGSDTVQPAEATGFSSLHYAYFADSWVELSDQVPMYKGTGVGYWDVADQNLAPFGKHSARHAAGLAYCEMVDPSWLAISDAISSQSPMDPAAFWAEKKIPRWMRYGGASYVERFYQDKDAEDQWWPRKWALQNLQSGGDLVFGFELSLEDIPGSSRLIHEAGLVVSFLLDGGCVPVSEAHQAFRATLKKGEDTAETLEALQQAIRDNEAALKKYAGM